MRCCCQVNLHCRVKDNDCAQMLHAPIKASPECIYKAYSCQRPLPQAWELKGSKFRVLNGSYALLMHMRSTYSYVVYSYVETQVTVPACNVSSKPSGLASVRTDMIMGCNMPRMH